MTNPIKELAEAVMARRDDGLTRRIYGVSVKAGTINDAARSVRVIASSEAVDSYDEIVEQDWDLDRYKSNPTLLYGHNSWGFLGPLKAEETLPIGYTSDVGVSNGQLEATLNFVDEAANPMAEKVWQGFKQGSMRAVSVGFRPGEKVTQKMADGREVVRLRKNSLFEISAVPIGANAEAVARAIASASRREDTHAAEAKAQTMTNEEITALEATIAEAKAAVETAHAEIATLTERAETAEKALSEAVSRATAAEDRATKAESEVNALEVKALVGVKILPTEVEDFTELRASNKKLFDSMVEKRAALTLLADVLPDEKQTNSVATPGGSEDLATLAKSDDASLGSGEDLASLAATN